LTAEAPAATHVTEEAYESSSANVIVSAVPNRDCEYSTNYSAEYE